MSEEQKTNVPLIGEIYVEGEAPPVYYQAFLKAQRKAEDAAERAENAAAKIEVDQEYIDAQVFSAGQAAEIAAAAARDAAQSEQNIKGDADRAADAAGIAEASAERAESAAAAVGEALKNARDYYHTEREELGVEHNRIKTAYVYSLYDALVDAYKIVDEETGEVTYRYITPNWLTDNSGKNAIREYVINCNTDGIYAQQFGFDDPARKPKYLIMSGIHGTERNAVFSTYRFVRDMINGHNVPKAFRDGAVIHVIPVADPDGFDTFTYGHEPYQISEYTDDDGVQKIVSYLSIDKNFDWKWQEGKDNEQAKLDSGEYGEPYVYGSAAGDMPATQAITKWLNENSDAAAFINYHNNGFIHENVAIIAPADDEADRVKRAAMRGVDRVIPYWRDVIGYPDVETVRYWSKTKKKFLTAVKPVIFSYSATGVTPASSTGYALNVLGIPSIYMETSAYYGNFSDWWDYDGNKNKLYYEDIVNTNADKGEGRPTYQPEVIAMGAEAIGNILIELFSEASEVKDMAGVNSKLDILIEDDMVEVQNKLDTLIEEDMIEVQNKLDALMGQINSGFHAVRGVYNIRSGGIVAKDEFGNPLPNDTITHQYYDIPKDAKLVIIQADAPTQAAIETESTNFTLSIKAEFTTDAERDNSCQVTCWKVSETETETKTVQEAKTALWYNDLFTAVSYALHEGAYNWTAYYWNEGEAIPAWTGGSY